MKISTNLTQILSIKKLNINFIIGLYLFIAQTGKKENQNLYIILKVMVV